MKMRPRELRELSVDDLIKKAQDLSAELLKLRLEFRAARTVASPRWKNLRRDLARVMTILKEKEQVNGAAI